MDCKTSNAFKEHETRRWAGFFCFAASIIVAVSRGCTGRQLLVLAAREVYSKTSAKSALISRDPWKIATMESGLVSLRYKI